MEKISVALLTFLLNAAWQVSVVAVVASAASRVLRTATARSRHFLWVAALLVALGLPLLRLVPLARQERQHKAVPAAVDRNPAATDPLPESPPETSASVPRTAAPGPALQSSRFPRDFSVPARLANMLLIIYAAVVFWRGTALIYAWLRTRQLVRSSATAEFPQAVQGVIARCLEQTRVGAVRLLSSPVVLAPLTVGAMPPIIVLPEKLVAEPDEALLVSAIGHELVHIARRDYLLNFVYRLLYIPLSFHPAAALIKRRIDETRELRCDEVVTDRLLSPAAYARSLVTLAGAAHAFRGPRTVAVGIADADILEERIMSMLKKRRISSARRTLLLATAALVFAVPCIAAAPYAMHLKIDAVAPRAMLQPPAAHVAAAVADQPPAQESQATQRRNAEFEAGLRAGQAYANRNPNNDAPAERARAQAELLARESIGFAYAQEPQESEARLKRKLEEKRAEEERNLTPEERAAREKLLLEKIALRRKELAELSKAAKITMQQAIDAALRQQQGTVMESSLMGQQKFVTRQPDGTFTENTMGDATPIYRIVILSGDENAPVRTIVQVSALDGSILRTVVE